MTTVKIIYNNIQRYIKGKNKLIAGALYLISTLFCKQCWQYCHYIWNGTEIKEKHVPLIPGWICIFLKSNAMQHNSTDPYSELNSTLKKMPQDKEASRNQWKAPCLAIQLLLLLDSRGRALVKVSNQHSSHTWKTVSYILMSTEDDSIPVDYVPFLAPGISKPTSAFLHCLWINAMGWFRPVN